jgi:hypothetical protein
MRKKPKRPRQWLLVHFIHGAILPEGGGSIDLAGKVSITRLAGKNPESSNPMSRLKK